MKLKRITLVVMGLAGAPAIAAAQSTVQIYGTANVDIESVEATGAASGQNFGSESDCTREVDTELRAEGLQWGARVIRLRPAR